MSEKIKVSQVVELLGGLTLMADAMTKASRTVRFTPQRLYHWSRNDKIPSWFVPDVVRLANKSGHNISTEDLLR